KQTLEGHIVKALRLGDVKKSLRLLISAPLADKGPETVAALRKLHPGGPDPEPVASSPGPRWSSDVVGPALCSFGWVCCRPFRLLAFPPPAVLLCSVLVLHKSLVVCCEPVVRRE